MCKWYIPNVYVPYFFYHSLAWSKYLSHFVFSLIYPLWYALAAKSSIRLILFFFVKYYLVRASGRNEVIFYLKIQMKFIRLILQDRYCCIIITLWEFLTQILAEGFNWILNGKKSPQISEALHSIIFHPYNAVVWTVFTCILISKSSIPFTDFVAWFERTNHSWNHHLHVP